MIINKSFAWTVDIRYQKSGIFSEGDTGSQIIDREPCIHEAGRIEVGDAGSITLLSSDDAFQVYVDGEYRGEKSAGESDVFLFNPINNGRKYPSDGHSLELQVTVAPDGWGTHYVEFFGDERYFFESGDKVDEEDILGGDVGDTVTFDNVVCVASTGIWYHVGLCGSIFYYDYYYHYYCY